MLFYLVLILLKDKEIREMVNQYNHKHKDAKVEVSEDRLYTPTQRPNISETNNLNSKIDN